MNDIFIVLIMFILINIVKDYSKNLAKGIAITFVIAICANLGHDIYDNHQRKQSEMVFLKEEISKIKEELKTQDKLLNQYKEDFLEIVYIPKNAHLDGFIVKNEIFVDSKKLIGTKVVLISVKTKMQYEYEIFSVTYEKAFVKKGNSEMSIPLIRRSNQANMTWHTVMLDLSKTIIETRLQSHVSRLEFLNENSKNWWNI